MIMRLCRTLPCRRVSSSSCRRCDSNPLLVSNSGSAAAPCERHSGRPYMPLICAGCMRMRLTSSCHSRFDKTWCLSSLSELQPGLCSLVLQAAAWAVKQSLAWQVHMQVVKVLAAGMQNWDAPPLYRSSVRLASERTSTKLASITQASQGPPHSSTVPKAACWCSCI